MKRYAIVRVDTYCPSKFADNVKNEYVCEEINSNEEEHDICGKCRYGDTKEQLIRKVATALQICDKNRVEKCNQFYFVAKEIVEFLGVEE